MPAAAAAAAAAAPPPTTLSVACRAPINMAVLKYWGKRDPALILPLHSSLSLTLHVGCMASTVRATLSGEYDRDLMVLNGAPVDVAASARLRAVLDGCRSMATPVLDRAGRVVVDRRQLIAMKVRLECSNDFPTAAGLASSASGYACLTAALADLYGCREAFAGQLTTIARQGSGSACRSMFGGAVKWIKGQRDDGADSIAVQVAPEQHWADLRVLILVVNADQKETSSTGGMERSTETSELLAHRAEHIVDGRLAALEKSILERDFPTFAELTMRDSNQFHAVCADTYPPIFYLNQTSHRIIETIHSINDESDQLISCYTFDAGPNACIFTLNEHLPIVAARLLSQFRPDSVTMQEFVSDPLHLLPTTLPTVDGTTVSTEVKQMIVTKVGPGPQISESSRHNILN